MLALIALLLAAMLPLSLWMLVRNPFNTAAIVSFLTWTFGVGPGVYFLATGSIPSYSWRNFVFVGGPLSVQSDAQATLISLCQMSSLFTAGACAGWALSTHPQRIGVAPRVTSELTTAAMTAIWAASALYFFFLSRWNVWEFLLPVRETAKASGYLDSIFIMMPLAIVAKSYWARGRLDWKSLLWIAIALMAAFSRDQRRDFVTMALFMVGLLTIVHEIVRKPKTTSRVKGATRPNSMVLGIFSLIGAAVLVPLLWYSRVYFTTQSRGEDIDPTQIRSFSDLLLGSPATGFPTLGLIRDFVSQTGTHIFHIPTYLSAMVVPRAAWAHKPTDIDSKLQAAYHLMENPSSFWFGELYYCFGAFSTMAAALFGFVAFRTAHEFNSSRSLLMRTIGAVIFMQSVTLYKNGFSQFALNSLTLASFLLLAWILPADRARSLVKPTRSALQRVPLKPSILP